MPITATPDLALAAGWDAGNRAAMAAGRTAWTRDDYNAAIRAYAAIAPGPAPRPRKAATRGGAPIILTAAERAHLAATDPDGYRAYMATVDALETVEFYLAAIADGTEAHAAALALAAELRTRKATPADKARLWKLQQTTRANPARPWRFVAERDAADAEMLAELTEDRRHGAA